MIEEPNVQENEAHSPDNPECEDKAAEQLSSEERDSFCVAVSMGAGGPHHTQPHRRARLPQGHVDRPQPHGLCPSQGQRVLHHTGKTLVFNLSTKTKDNRIKY